ASDDAAKRTPEHCHSARCSRSPPPTLSATSMARSLVSRSAGASTALRTSFQVATPGALAGRRPRWPRAPGIRSSGGAAGRQHDLAMRIDEAAAPRRQARQQFRARAVRQAEAAPARAIAIDGDATIARPGAAGRTMRDGIDEEQRVALFEVAFDGAHDLVDRGLLRALLDRHGLRVAHVRLVRAGDHHGGAIARPDIGEGHQDVDLPTVELAGMVAELGADGADMA